MSGSLVKIRDLFSKWLMRSLQAGKVLRIPLLGVTAASTFVTALRGTFLEPFIFHILFIGFVSGVLFIWLYDRFKVLNTQHKFNADRSSNYVGPDKTMNKLIDAKQRAVMSKSISEGWSTEKTQEVMEEVTKKNLRNWRDGIDVEGYLDKDNSVDKDTKGSK